MKYKVVKQNTIATKCVKHKKFKPVTGKQFFTALRGVASVILLFVAIAAILFVTIPMLPDEPVAEGENTVERGVLELWNIECFEGGVGSRQNWLTKRAKEFEQNNKGLYVHVSTLTFEQAKIKLDNGESFDLVGFSRGAGNLFADKLCVVDLSSEISDNLRQSATFGNRAYAFPYYCGIYCLFSRQSELSKENLLSECTTKTITRKVGKNVFVLTPIVSGFADFNSPYTALFASGGKGYVEPSEKTTQYAAYEQFVGHKTAVTLLGTQRDLYRLKRRTADGKIEPLSILPLDGYNDLVQYVGISINSDKIASAKAFCSYLVGKKAQATLTDNGLFSVLADADYYTDEIYRACQLAVGSVFVPFVFDDEQTIALQRKQDVHD